MVLLQKNKSVSVNALKRHCQGESGGDHRCGKILTNIVLIISLFFTGETKGYKSESLLEMSYTFISLAPLASI